MEVTNIHKTINITVSLFHAFVSATNFMQLARRSLSWTEKQKERLKFDAVLANKQILSCVEFSLYHDLPAP